MALTFGFYNSLNGDRKYNAIQFGQLFDGIIQNGIFMSIGDKLMVTAGEGMTINVGTGRAWFNSTWTLNDSVLPLTVENAEVLLNRIDAVILEVNTNSDVRENSIKIIKGTPSSSPGRPSLSNTNGLYQYPLAWITVNQGVTTITQAEIENAVGTSNTPFVTGILESMDIDALVAQWETQWINWMEEMTQSSIDFQDSQELAFNTWFDTIKGQLSEDAAGNLQNQIYDLYDKNEFFNELVVSEEEYKSNLSSKLDEYIQTTNGRSKQKGDQVKVICDSLHKTETWLCVRNETSKALSWMFFSNSKIIETNYLYSTILATGWSEDGIYSFEDVYPNTGFDLEVSPSDSCDADELTAWGMAEVLGSAVANTLKASGEIPLIDIPIILKVVNK